DASTAIAKRSLAFSLANLRNGNGDPVLTDSGLRGLDTYWSRNGAWDSTAATVLIADPSTVRIGVRQDVTVKFLDQATIGDGRSDRSTAIAKRSLAFSSANLRNGNGDPVLTDSGLRGLDTYWSRNGAWDSTAATVLIADPSTVRIGVRQDVTVKFLDQATIGDGAGGLISLAERDMVALRFKARFAYVLGQVATPETGARSYGVGAVTPASTETP